MMWKLRKVSLRAVLMGLLMLLGAFQPANAGVGLKAFSPNPAVLDGVVTGGMPAWYQDQSGVAVDACFDIINCGLVGFLPNNALPLAFPTNFPDEAFYFLSQADITMTGGATASIIMALEYTFVNPVSGALTGPVATPTALSAPFQRLRVIETIPGGGGVLPPAAAGGNFTVVTPWGDTVIFAAADARCANSGGDTKCTMTQDIPGPGGLPPSAFFAQALAANVPGSIDRFIRSTVPPPPVGFLGNGGAAVSAVLTNGAAAVVTLTDPLGNTGNNGPGGSYSTLVGKITGMDVQPAANLNLGAKNITTVNAPGAVLVPTTVTVTNTTGFDFTFPALATAGVDAADFIITSPPTAGGVGCSGTLVPIGTPCSFDITFKPAAAPKAARVATILLAPTTGIAANDPPPVTMNLTGTAEVLVTTTAAGQGTVTPATAAVGAGTAANLTATPADVKFKVREVADGAQILTPTATGTIAVNFTIPNTGAIDHAVTATFMPSGDLTADGKLDIADAQKALKIVAGVQAAAGDDKPAMIVAPLGTDKKPVLAPTRVEPNIGDVLVILRRVVGLETW